MGCDTKHQLACKPLGQPLHLTARYDSLVQMLTSSCSSSALHCPSLCTAMPFTSATVSCCGASAGERRGRRGDSCHGVRCNLNRRKGYDIALQRREAAAVLPCQPGHSRTTWQQCKGSQGGRSAEAMPQQAAQHMAAASKPGSASHLRARPLCQG